MDFNIRDNFGRTALIEAVINGQEETAHLILDLANSSVDVNIADSSVGTSLHAAIRKDMTSIVRRLVSGRADLRINGVDHEGRTAVALAAELCRPDLVSVVLGRRDLDINRKVKLCEIILLDKSFKEGKFF